MRSFIFKTILILTMVLIVSFSFNITYAYDLDFNINYYEEEINREEIREETNRGQIKRGQINTEPEAKEVISFSNDDLYLLSKLITGEARGESYEGQLAVAAVVINRVQDPRFPKTIKDVIYQPKAFSAVSDGQINLTPTDTSIKAAREALKGQDPTKGAIFYWNPDIATCNWIKTLEPHERIGNHVFAK
jgi:N-acetylmuramoyl-L-alanine amidase